MAVRGVFTSHSGIIGERGEDFDSRILMHEYGGMAPMLALSSGMPSTPVKQINFSWTEDEHISGNQKVVTGGNSAAVSMVVDNAGIWAKNQVLMNEMTGEYVLVTGINVDNVTVAIRRGWAGTTAQTIATDDTFQSIGTAFAEGSGKPDPVAQQGETRSNLIQIFKNGWAITGTAKAVTYHTGSKMARNKAQCAAYFAEDQERAFLWGRKALTTQDGKQLRATNGIIPQIEDYGGLVVSAASGGVSGALNFTDFLSFMRRIFDKNAKGMSNERIAFCGSQLLELIQRMVMLDGSLQITQTEKAYGLNVTTINAINGQLKLVTHPMMVENLLWQRQLYVLHPGLISKRVLRPTWNQEFLAGNNTNNGIDADEGFLAVEQGFQVKGAQTMGIYKNIRTAAASF